MRCTNSLFGSFKVLGNCVKQLSSWAALNSIRMVARAFVKVLWPITIYVYSVNRAVSCRWEMCVYLCSTDRIPSLISFRFVSFATLNAVRSLFAFCWEAFFWWIDSFQDLFQHMNQMVEWFEPFMGNLFASMFARALCVAEGFFIACLVRMFYASSFLCPLHCFSLFLSSLCSLNWIIEHSAPTHSDTCIKIHIRCACLAVSHCNYKLRIYVYLCI